MLAEPCSNTELKRAGLGEKPAFVDCVWPALRNQLGIQYPGEIQPPHPHQ